MKYAESITLKLVEVMRQNYIELQKRSHHPFNADVAIATDGVRASLRDSIAETLGRSSEDVQNEIEYIAANL